MPGPPVITAPGITLGRPRARRTGNAGYILGWRPSVRLVEVVPQHLGARRVAELRHGLRLDLPDPLPGHAGQRAEHRLELLLQQGEADRLAGLDRLRILDQVAELAVPVLAQRNVQGDRLPGVLLHLD